MPYAIRKVDINQKEIVYGLRALGYTVRHTHTVGHGFPDIAIGKNGVTVLVEIKRHGEELTEQERDFFTLWSGAAMIGYDVEQIHADFERMTK